MAVMPSPGRGGVVSAKCCTFLHVDWLPVSCLFADLRNASIVKEVPPNGSTYLLLNQPRFTRVAGPSWLPDGNPQFLLQIANGLGPTPRWPPLAQADGLVLDLRDHLDGD